MYNLKSLSQKYINKRKLIVNPEPFDIYSIVKYNKHIKPNKIIRSIVIENSTFKVVSFSPPKSIPFADFLNTCDNPENIDITEIIEGTMINMFYNESIGWTLATKSIIGGLNKYYFDSKSTFYDMFYDCFESKSELNKFNPKYCYSFVLQHPHNTIVYEIVKPRLYLISIYEINDNVVREKEITSSIKKSLPKCIEYPTKYDAVPTCDNGNIDKPVGYMLKNKASGLRTKIINPNYLQKKQALGNFSSIMTLYIYHMRNNTLGTVLELFPRYKEVFEMVKYDIINLSEQINNDYQNYMYGDDYRHLIMPSTTFYDNLHLYLKNSEENTIYTYLLEKCGIKTILKLQNAFKSYY